MWSPRYQVRLIYLASPFFNDEQSNREERVANKLTELGYVVIRPKYLAMVSPDATQEERDAVVKMDLEAIDQADLVFAVTNGRDMGTMLEAGYAIAKGKPVVYFGEGFTGKFNVMLAGTAKAVFTELDQITRELVDLAIMGERVTVYDGQVE